MRTDELYWLHVPLETSHGQPLKLLSERKLNVLGHPASLMERTGPLTSVSMGTPVVHQWLLFDPMPEATARALLENLRERLPIVAFRTEYPLRVAGGALEMASGRAYDGQCSTLIPARLSPTAWSNEFEFSAPRDGVTILEEAVSASPALKDERLLAAFDMLAASRYDTLPRSIFLTHLTILDSLAVRAPREEHIQAWLDDRIKEARVIKDQSLVSGLEGLKQRSHGTAVQDLVVRAAQAKGETPARIKELKTLAGTLYRSRSRLSHAGGSGDLDLTGAHELVSLVLEMAVTHPALLNDQQAHGAVS